MRAADSKIAHAVNEGEEKDNANVARFCLMFFKQ